MTYQPVYINVNEEGERYGIHDSLDPALELLYEHPNDTIIVWMRTVPEHMVNDSIPLSEYEQKAEARLAVEEDDDFAHMVIELAAEVRRLATDVPGSAVVLIYNRPGDEGCAYTLRLPSGEEVVIGDADSDYWTLANIIDKHFPINDKESTDAVSG